MDEPVSAGDRDLRLGDRARIEDLFTAYAYHFDRNEPAEVAALFTDDAVVDYGPEMANLSGRHTIESGVAAGLRDIFTATSHHISNVAIDFIDETRARAVAYVYAWHRYRDGSPDGFLWAQYHVGVRRRRGGWRFSEMTLKAAGSTDFHRSEMHPIGRNATARG